MRAATSNGVAYPENTGSMRLVDHVQSMRVKKHQPLFVMTMFTCTGKRICHIKNRQYVAVIHTSVSTLYKAYAANVYMCTNN
jgi:hypothetical protein